MMKVRLLQKPCVRLKESTCYRAVIVPYYCSLRTGKVPQPAKRRADGSTPKTTTRPAASAPAASVPMPTALSYEPSAALPFYAAPPAWGLGPAPGQTMPLPGPSSNQMRHFMTPPLPGFNAPTTSWWPSLQSNATTVVAPKPSQTKPLVNYDDDED